MELGIDVVIEDEKIKVDVETDYLKGDNVYPELENLTITPSSEEQKFKSDKYGYDTVTVKAVDGETLEITPMIEEQTYSGLYNTVNVKAIETQKLTVIPSLEEQQFNGLYDYVVVGKVTGDKLNVTPTTEEQVFTGIYNEVSIDAIEGDTLNVTPTMEEQSFTGVYEQVNVGKIETEQLTIVPSSKEQNFSGLYDNIKALPMSEEIVVSYEEPTGENRKALWLQKNERNLFPIRFEVGAFYNTNVNNRAYDYSNYEVKVGETYTFSTSLDKSKYKFAIAICSDKFPTGTTSTSNFSYDSGWKTEKHTFTVLQDGYLAIGVANLDDGAIYKDWSINGPSQITNINSNYWYQLEEGSEATEYEPYIEPKLYMLNDNNEYEEFK